MWISPAFAHGSSGVESTGLHGPTILLIVAVVVVTLLVVEKKWRRRKQLLQNDVDQATHAEPDVPTVE
jgi:hypothetical protein